MHIQLKQVEIEAALIDFIAKQGIDMNDRSVDITFVSGRKGKGLIAELEISDGPAFINSLIQPVALPEEADDTPAFDPTDRPQESDNETDSEEATVATSSLFNN